MSDLDSIDDWVTHFKEQYEMLEDLLLDKDGNLVDKEEYHRRLYVQYGVTLEEDENGTTHYHDPTVEWRHERANDDEFVETVISRENIPVLKGARMIEISQHPDELPDPRTRAERQMAFNEVVDEEFDRQLEEEDDPFPLEYPPDE